MEVTRITKGSFQLAGAQDRPLGVHLSDVIKDLLVQVDPKRYAKVDPKTGELIPMNEIKVASGLSFEEALEKTFKVGNSGAFRPDPIFVPVPETTVNTDKIVFPTDKSFAYNTKGGIWCSLDALDPDMCPGLLVVREFKLTWYSQSKIFPGDPVYWPWLVQVQGYCKAAGTHLAAITVMHINGDYKPPTPSEPITYGLEFTPQEIEENWHMVIQHALNKGRLIAA